MFDHQKLHGYQSSIRFVASVSTAALDVIDAKGLVEPDRVVECKKMLVEIVSMLVRLMKANSEDRRF